MKIAHVCTSIIASIGVILGGCSNSEKEVSQTNRPYAGVNSWLNFNSACKVSNGDDWKCEEEYLVKLDSIKKKGDILLFENWYGGTYYKNAINCRKSEVYEFNPSAKGVLKYTGGFKFDPKGDLGLDAVAGKIFCELASSSSNKSFSLTNENSWAGVNPLGLNGKWVKQEDEFMNTNPYDYYPYDTYYNQQVIKMGNSIIYAIYNRYNPPETIWSRIWSATRITTPRPNRDIWGDFYGWRKVNCDNGDRYEFLPYTPMGDALSSQLYRGVWLPRPMTPGNISRYIRRTYC